MLLRLSNRGASSDRTSDGDGREDGMKIIAADLSEHHQRWHVGLEIDDEQDVRGDSGQQVQPPGSWRRQEQRRDENCAWAARSWRCQRAET